MSHPAGITLVALGVLVIVFTAAELDLRLGEHDDDDDVRAAQAWPSSSSAASRFPVRVERSNIARSVSGRAASALRTLAARSLIRARLGRPVLPKGVTMMKVTYSVTVSAVARSGTRPRSAHQAVKADQSAA
ncbi:hypothetical protein SAMN05421833_12952 [Microbispora rosea]|uniref:Uncharacterized protein n=1 Tax=Microbispora rosea TaxID=58117 RepID=A0A1N7GI80_9ACTN|nr:hypothetical protein [Microbispora rosea]GIH51640.1 hypothetical protein Mro03_68190 [Microbispora rosea subsp. rosea]SIS12303.1 hypothetical protein SAMN05421833_12952 [Microbispora rosea]